ncbi:TPR end-of-group domain-containing protein [Leptolyngbya sp. NIES-2104]|uniref:TPR end-of-group domain-containing protein n=1 Tax=Leptolyngbya sp. NIES-2104 TaxID=1552121 RepID=UPI004040057C
MSDSLKEMIALDSKYRQDAKTDSDFDSIRNDDRLLRRMNSDLSPKLARCLNKTICMTVIIHI